eukprot:TRINITY_DN4765_c0_g1_i12.p1 TRINITY_DN4765_c0_g1~~TRINITY_DN4765_c0_g1_i12.p1  ORF type:complete len:243 (+),score=-5.03 TRINITY_DN4765_c0_g1_i12:679-1407(+)
MKKASQNFTQNKFGKLCLKIYLLRKCLKIYLQQNAAELVLHLDVIFNIKIKNQIKFQNNTVLQNTFIWTAFNLDFYRQSKLTWPKQNCRLQELLSSIIESLPKATLVHFLLHQLKNCVYQLELVFFELQLVDFDTYIVQIFDLFQFFSNQLAKNYNLDQELVQIENRSKLKCLTVFDQSRVQQSVKILSLSLKILNQHQFIKFERMRRRLASINTSPNKLLNKIAIINKTTVLKLQVEWSDF